MTSRTTVETIEQLHEAVEAKAASIEIAASMSGLGTLTLAPGQKLQGRTGRETLTFAAGLPGVMLTTDCGLQGLRVETDETQIAVGLVDDGADLGQIAISDLVTVGRFHLEARSAMKGHLVLKNIHVARADARMVAHRPAGYGVEVLAGGLSVLNGSREEASVWTMEAENLSGGTEATPLQGSGIFIFGGDHVLAGTDPITAPGPDARGGRIMLARLTTGAVFTNGGIPPGTGNLITGGVFVGSGVVAELVINEGPVTTFGSNDMVLDNWGSVRVWKSLAPITSRGPSGIGFVNFGALDLLEVDAPVVTHGLGARGFNLYDGKLGEAKFRDITTHGDGAIGIQISKPFGSIHVKGDLLTLGGIGDSLVRGQVVRLKAHALSLKPGAAGDLIEITGKVGTAHADIAPFDDAAPTREIACIVFGDQVM